MRSIRRSHYKRGAGFSTGEPLSKEAYYVPEYTRYTNCYDQARPGAIQSNPNPSLAQTPMAGGKAAHVAGGRKSRRTTRRLRTGTCGYYGARGGSRSATRGGGCGCLFGRGGSRKTRRASTRKVGGFGCGMKRGGSCGMKLTRGGSCGMKLTRGRRSMRGGFGCGMKLTRGGRRRTMRGGRYGIDVSQSIGGDGPNVAPITAHVPCEAHRPMPLNPTSAGMLTSMSDPEVSVSGLRPGPAMFGGGAPAGEHPLAYTAPRAGFTFTPNIAQGQTLQPGQIPYNVVVPQEQPCANATCGDAIGSINNNNNNTY